MKKLSSILLAVLLALCMAVGFLACETSLNEPQDDGYCDPKGKVWYNRVSLPNLSDPFEESYDGIYSIEIDDSGKVVFKPSDGVILNGDLTASNRETHEITDISIQFEDGTTATGTCRKGKSTTGETVPFLDIMRRDLSGILSFYYFSDKQQLSKVEFETYRSQFIDFLIDVYQTDEFPTEEEIENNELYQKFVDYSQIDPCCGGPFTYFIAEKVVIEKVERKIYYEDSIVLTLTLNGGGETRADTSNTFATTIKNGEIIEMPLSEVVEGECLIVRGKGHGNYNVDGIIYIQND